MSATIKGSAQFDGIEETSSLVGLRIKTYRRDKKWSLKELSEKSEVPVSTLSKVENGQMSLNIEKLMRVCTALDIDIMQLVSPAASEPSIGLVTGRRSITKQGEAIISRTENSVYEHHAHDLSHKVLAPAVIEILPGRSPDLLKHHGEEFIFVLEGRIEALTEFYEPVLLEPGESIYIDSTMGHNVRALDDKPARVLNVSTSLPRRERSE